MGWFVVTFFRRCQKFLFISAFLSFPVDVFFVRQNILLRNIHALNKCTETDKQHEFEKKAQLVIHKHEEMITLQDNQSEPVQTVNLIYIYARQKESLKFFIIKDVKIWSFGKFTHQMVHLDAVHKSRCSSQGPRGISTVFRIASNSKGNLAFSFTICKSYSRPFASKLHVLAGDPGAKSAFHQCKGCIRNKMYRMRLVTCSMQGVTSPQAQF